MRYAIFSDVHANWQAWEAMLADALRQGADTLVCLGDVVGYGPRPLEVLRAVREATPNFVLGNHDAAACGRLDASIFNERARAVIEWTRDQLDEDALSFLREVPLQMDGEGVQFVHAEIVQPGEFGYVDGVAPAEVNLHAMVQPIGFLGHTHLPLAYTMPRKGGQVTQLPPIDFEVERGRRYLINVGSVGEPRTTDVRASYVIYDDVVRTVSFRKVGFDVDGYIGDLAATGLEIRPYFVQVVEAGRVAGAPQPAAAPQLALAQLPKVAEVVVGRHGQVVMGTAGAATQWGTSPSPAVVAQPKAIPSWLVGVVSLLVLIMLGGVVAVVTKKPGQPVAGTPGGRDAMEAKMDGVRANVPNASLGKDDEHEEGRARRRPPREDNDPGSTDPPVVESPEQQEPDDEAPEVVRRVAPEKLSQDLVAYWSFDDPDVRESRFEQWDDGTVVEKLIRQKGQPVKYLVPGRDIGNRWTTQSYAASGWLEGNNGVGYGEGPGALRDLVASRIESEPGKHPHSVYVRIPFQVEDPGAYDGLLLYMRYDDGFVAYLNGRQCTSSKDHAPRLNNLRWNSAATRKKEDAAAPVPERFMVSPRRLVRGENVLAIHGLNYGGVPNETNTGSTSDDMLILPTLVARRVDSKLPAEAESAGPSEHDQLVPSEQLAGTITSVKGRFREAYRFEDDGRIVIGESDRFAIGEGSFTVSLWFTRAPASIDSQARRLISAGAGGDSKPGWALWLTRKCDGLTFAVGNGRDRDSTTAKEASLASGEWRHAAVTVDRESQSVALFIDGQLVADRRISLLGDGPIGSNSGLEIGKNSDDEQHHRGEIDDVAIWKRALLPGEIEKIFKEGEPLGELFKADEE